MFLVPMTHQASELSRQFDRLFDDDFLGRFFSPSARGEAGGARSPALDVSEGERAYTVRVDLPGIRKEDVKITIDGRRVAIEARTTQNEERKEGDRVVYSERSVASYARSFTLPAEVDQAESQARIEHGVLTLTLPKKRAANSVQIPVK